MAPQQRIITGTVDDIADHDPVLTKDDIAETQSTPPDTPSLTDQAIALWHNRPPDIFDLMAGQLQGAAHSAIGLGQLAEDYVPGVHAAQQALWGPGATLHGAEKAPLLQPRNFVGQIGRGLEQGAEFLTPGAATEGLAAKVPEAAQWIARAALGAGENAAVTKVQGGDVATAAKLGAIFPMAGQVINDAKGVIAPLLAGRAATQVAKALPAGSDALQSALERPAPVGDGTAATYTARNMPWLVGHSGLAKWASNLGRQAQAQAVAAIDAATAAGVRVPTAPIIDALELAKRDYMGVPGAMPMAPPYALPAGQGIVHNAGAVANLDDLIAQVKAYGADMPPDAAKKLRGIWGDIGAGAKDEGFLQQPFMSVSDAAAKGAHQTGTQAMRAEIADVIPGVKDPNAITTYSIRLQKLAQAAQDAAPRGGGSVMRVAGAAGGGASMEALAAFTHSPMLATVAATTGSIATAVELGRLLQTPAYRLLSAKVQQTLADAIASGQASAITNAMGRIAAAIASQTTQPRARRSRITIAGLGPGDVQ